MSKSHPYVVTDVNALKEAYPMLVTEKTVIVQEIDHAKLYQLVKTNRILNLPLPAGVEFKTKKTAAEGAASEAAPAAGSEE